MYSEINLKFQYIINFRVLWSGLDSYKSIDQFQSYCCIFRQLFRRN